MLVRVAAWIAIVTAPLLASATTYSTDFSTDEDPISEGGRWVNGLDVGLDWGNVATSGGFAQARLNNGGGPSYNDSTALLTGSWGANQTVNVTVHRSAAVVEGDYPEVEIRLHSSLAAHSCTGYEIMWSLRSDASCYVAIVRWNGAFGDFTVLASVTGSEYVLGDGARLSATISGDQITAYIGDRVVVTATDSMYASGSPGVGFDHNGPSSDDNTFGLSDFTASDEPSSAPDAGTTTGDAGTSTDAAVATDAGTMVGDGGHASGSDGGHDAGMPSTTAGCGCSMRSTRGAPFFSLALLVLAARRRVRPRGKR